MQITYWMSCDFEFYLSTFELLSTDCWQCVFGVAICECSQLSTYTHKSICYMLDSFDDSCTEQLCPGDVCRVMSFTWPFNDCLIGKWNAVLLGRKTWESLDVTAQPLPGRLNIVISNTLK